MFITILYYFIVAMLVVGAIINFILWMVELKDTYAYKHMVLQRKMAEEAIKK